MTIFTAPEWVPPLPTIPDSISIGELMLDEKYGRKSFSESLDPFTCGLSGKTYTNEQVLERTDALTRALSKELGWKSGVGSEWDKVMGVFALNTIDTMTLAYAVHALDGISTPANAAYSAAELEYQLKDAGAKALFTCLPLLATSLEACKGAGIPKNRIYILEMPVELTGPVFKVPFKTLDDFINEGRSLPPVKKVKWKKGQGGTQTAFLCYSSGTSGLPKGVMISHRNVITNVLQISTKDSISRKSRSKTGKLDPEVVLGLLPQSHIYGLVVISFAAAYQGDQIIILPKFDLNTFLTAIAKFHIAMLFVVPPIIIQLINSASTCAKYDISSVQAVFTGAAPLGAETAQALQKQYPKWRIKQGYGLTETSTVVSSSPDFDIHFGTSGSLLPGMRCKLITPEGKEISNYNEPGELVVQSHSVVLGYLKNEKANKETFLPDEDGNGRWMKTGDEAIFSVSPNGNVHLTITDRIKELIKVKGLQVAPAELEAHILEHPSVEDVCVIAVPHDRSGETAKAFVVKSKSVGIEENDKMVARDIKKFVEKHKARHKWLDGGVEFIDVIPKSPSGKILRRLLRDKDKERRRKEGARL